MPGFLKSFSFVHRYVCVCVCVSAPEVINNKWRDMLRYRPCAIVKSILQLFSLLPSINWIGVTLVTQHFVYVTQRCQS